LGQSSHPQTLTADHGPFPPDALAIQFSRHVSHHGGIISGWAHGCRLRELPRARLSGFVGSTVPRHATAMTQNNAREEMHGAKREYPDYTWEMEPGSNGDGNRGVEPVRHSRVCSRNDANDEHSVSSRPCTDCFVWIRESFCNQSWYSAAAPLPAWPHSVGKSRLRCLF
jgi:hypothetical protein